jgi:hypothetical protein
MVDGPRSACAVFAFREGAFLAVGIKPEIVVEVSAALPPGQCRGRGSVMKGAGTRS